MEKSRESLSNPLPKDKKKQPWPFLVTCIYDQGIYAMIASKPQPSSIINQSHELASFPFSERFVIRQFSGYSMDEEIFQDRLIEFLKCYFILY